MGAGRGLTPRRQGEMLDGRKVGFLPMSRNGKILSPKQERFVAEYLVDMNATQAAIRAGYSRKTARQIGQENLTKPDIQDAIRAALNKIKERVELTQERVLENLDAAREGAMGANQFSAAVRATELQGKHLSMFEPKPDGAKPAVGIQIVIGDTPREVKVEEVIKDLGVDNDGEKDL